MSLSPGQKLAHYEIVESVGAGGMGEVYRARDTTLGRDVAIKVLPDEFSQDQERLARFEREARLLAQLNHANIAVLHGLEQSEGQRFLVMELVAGETLAERIAHGPIPLEEALPLFIQIAEGVEAAHDKAIIHRDLKPANIKIGPDGQVKILDFGLAKAFSPKENTSAETSQSPTLTKGTALGAIMGTASYMSPEQARGAALDKKADVWAFGCCLYEALTGNKAFDGDSITDILAAVVKSEPEWSALGTGTPARVRELIVRCLRKTPSKRVHDIADARLELEASVDEPHRQPIRAGRWSTSALVAFGLVCAMAALGLTMLVSSNRRDAPAPVRRLSANVLPLSGGTSSSWAISPDGSAVVAKSAGDSGGPLYIRRLDETELTPLDGTDNATAPFFSPDGQWIAFESGGRLLKTSVRGGAPSIICSAADIVHGGVWSSDDTIYFSLGSRMMSVPASGGVPEVLAEADPRSRRGFGRPSLLPDGRHLLVATWADPAGDSIGIYSLDDGETRLLIEDGYSPMYAPTGHLAFQRGGSLFAAPFDVDKRKVSGSAIPTGLVGSRFDLANDGTLAYKAQFSSAGKLVWVDRQGNDEPLFDREPGFRPYAALSPDERQLAVVSGGDDGLDIWVLELQSKVLSRVTFGRSVHPRWSPDGTEIFHSARTGGTFHVFSVSTRGGQPRRELVRDAWSGPSSVSPDGSTLFYRALGQGWDIGAVSLDGNSESKLLMATAYDEYSPMISPDGSQLAYVSNETARPEIYLTPYPALEGRRQVSNAGGTEPRWSRDGTELFYRNDDKLMSVTISFEPELRFGEPQLLFEGPYLKRTGSPGTSYDVTSDGRFVMITEAVDPEGRRIHFVLNWFEELERLVPTETQ